MIHYWEKGEGMGSPYSTRFAQVSGVLFVALPFQSFFARCGEMAAFVSHPKRGKWNAMVLSEIPSGKLVLLEDASFEDKDEVFYWSTGEMMAAQINNSVSTKSLI